MSDLSTFATHVRVQVTGQAIDQRFSEATANFFRELRNRAFTQVVATDPVAIRPAIGPATARDSTPPAAVAAIVAAKPMTQLNTAPLQSQNLTAPQFDGQNEEQDR